MKEKVLIVDDEASIRLVLRRFLELQGYVIEEASSCAEAEEAFRVTQPDAAVIDYKLPDGTALDLLARLKRIAPEIPLIILTGHASIDLAVRAIKEGADQFLTKPVKMPVLSVVVQRALDNHRNRQKQLAVRSRQARTSINPFLGSSQAVRHLAQQCQRVAASESPVLILGDTGTGKGVLARWLHNESQRADEAFVDLNCAGLSREFLETELFGHEKGAFTGAVSTKQGLLEIAHRGTVFLDEIGDVDLSVQPKLLKVLEEKRFRRLGEVRDRRVDIRLVAATHQELGHLIAEKRFRSDLYFRISTIPLIVPSLRQRVEDIPVLAQYLLDRLASDMGRGEVKLSNDALRALQSYSWPGNIRELRNVLERACLLTDKRALEAGDLFFDIRATHPIQTTDTSLTLAELEQLHIQRVLDEERGHVEQAARRLGIPRSSLYQKLKKYDLSKSRIQT